MSLSLQINEIIELFPDAKVSGTCKFDLISGIANLKDAKPGDLSFLGNPKYRSQVEGCRASVILLPQTHAGDPRNGQIFIFVPSPSRALAQICSLLEDVIDVGFSAGIHPTAHVEDTAQVDQSASVGAFSYIGRGAKVLQDCKIGTHCHVGSFCEVGSESTLHPGVKLLSRCEIGKKVILNAGVVIGSEGYGFDQSSEGHLKIPHLGKVIIEDEVEIGANTCIDRARFEETRVGHGTKIDNLVQIGHNVRIGKNCLIVAQVGVSGSVVMEDEVMVGGQAGFAGHLKVGKGAKIAGQAGITKDVEPGAFLKGNPALPFHLSQRISVLQRKLPELFKRFAEKNLQE